MLGRNTVRVLHAGSIAAGIGSVATAADLTFCGGAGTLIAGALSGVEIFKKSDAQTKDVATRFAEALDREFASASLTEDRKKIVAQMLDKFRPDAAMVTEADRDAVKIVAAMQARIEERKRPDDYNNDRALADFAQVVEPALREALVPVTDTEAFEKEILARTSRLLEQAEGSGGASRMRDEGITEKAIIRLAQRIARETEDLGQAWLELQNAMDIAARVQEEGRIGSNHGNFVDEVLRRVAELSRDGEYREALGEIEDALTRQEAEQVRLLESGVEVALLSGDAEKAAGLLVRKADLEAGGRAAFEALWRLQDEYLVRGRNKGFLLEQEVAIELARLLLPRATGSEERGAARNALGIALGSLGERESGTERLMSSVTNLRAALEEWPRTEAPQDWAMAQMNLGNALRTLGERKNSVALLKEAVAAFREALEARTREREPLNWALTQMNLGSALSNIGERESGTERLVDAVTAFQAALGVFTRAEVPYEWAGTQMNLGNALWAIGERDSGTARLVEAVAAYGAALTVWTRELVPIQWAVAKSNLAGLEIALFDKTGRVEHLFGAHDHYSAAKEVFVDARASHYLSNCDTIAARIESRWAGLPR